MYARMTVAQAKTDRFDKAVQAVKETFLPAAQEQAGYRGFLLLAERSSQEIIGISFWESEADMRATGVRGGYYQQQMADFVDLVEASPTTTMREVIVREP